MNDLIDRHQIKNLNTLTEIYIILFGIFDHYMWLIFVLHSFGSQSVSLRIFFTEREEGGQFPLLERSQEKKEVHSLFLFAAFFLDLICLMKGSADEHFKTAFSSSALWTTRNSLTLKRTWHNHSHTIKWLQFYLVADCPVHTLWPVS